MDNITKIINKPFSCSCGRVHEVSIGSVSLDYDLEAIDEACLKYFEGPHILVVSDNTTHEIHGRLITDVLKRKGFKVVNCLFQDKKVLPDERSLGTLLLSSSNKLQGVIAVGSGTITDLTRYVSARLGIPFLSVPTAPSMDGYASGVSSLIAGGKKTTFQGNTAEAILGNINIIAEAPLKMVQAGFGDIMGKKISVCDWILSHTLRDEYLCPYTLDLVESAADGCIERAADIYIREPQAIQYLMNALLLSGIAISIVGDSRPASGTEHLLAHYLEGAYLRQGREPIAHGIAVAVGTLCAGLLYDTLLLSEEWRDQGQSAEIREALGSRLPVPDEIKKRLEEIGLSCHPMDYGIDRELLREALLQSRFTRQRYTILSYAAEIGALESVTEKVLNTLCSA
ncbi:sn-glycerol-1-phosphate dehydrogenase [Paenibacillus sp. BR2-3]|uniref:sn-glycerol-1-phosphate dehydrogenase n=1 Tax=Paenibacillus sp. BR2-3 TaxID=3048494 RepID=UPI003977DB22